MQIVSKDLNLESVEVVICLTREIGNGPLRTTIYASWLNPLSSFVYW